MKKLKTWTDYFSIHVNSNTQHNLRVFNTLYRFNPINPQLEKLTQNKIRNWKQTESKLKAPKDLFSATCSPISHCERKCLKCHVALQHRSIILMNLRLWVAILIGLTAINQCKSTWFKVFSIRWIIIFIG